MSEEEEYTEAMTSAMEYESEIEEHNLHILESINDPGNHFEELMSHSRITGKMEWADVPHFNPEYEQDITEPFSFLFCAVVKY